jgi:hypothetical protein
MEELIMGLYGGLGAPGAEDELRRGGRRAPGQGGYEGIGGNLVQPGQFAPFLGGQGGPGFSGAIGRNFQQGGQGLAGLLQQLAGHGQGMNDFQGPAFRNFTNQGFDFMPPGQNNQNPVGGPNIAPGNIENAQALFQPMGPGHVPGVPQGVAVGQQAGRTMPMPQTQGWRNVHPGYSAAAQAGYGTPQWGGYQGEGRGAVAPGDIGVGGPGGDVQAPAHQGGGGGAEQAPQRPGTNVSGVQQGGGGGGGGGGSQGTAGGGGGGGKQTSSGGGGGGVSNANLGVGTGGVAGAPERQSADQRAAGNIAAGAGGKKLGGSPLLDALGAIQKSGNEGSSEAQRRAAAPKAKNFGQRAQGGLKGGGKLSGLSASEKAAKKEAWQAKVEAKQERARVQAAPSASSFGKNSATNDRGTGLEPIKGKTKPKGSTSAQQR